MSFDLAALRGAWDWSDLELSRRLRKLARSDTSICASYTVDVKNTVKVCSIFASLKSVDNPSEEDEAFRQRLEYEGSDIILPRWHDDGFT
jgi:hypothetical protein